MKLRSIASFVMATALVGSLPLGASVSADADVVRYACVTTIEQSMTQGSGGRAYIHYENEVVFNQSELNDHLHKPRREFRVTPAMVTVTREGELPADLRFDFEPNFEFVVGFKVGAMPYLILDGTLTLSGVGPVQQSVALISTATGVNTYRADPGHGLVFDADNHLSTNSSILIPGRTDGLGPVGFQLSCNRQP